jgi:hypothetical protein
MGDELTDIHIELDLEDGVLLGHILSAVDDVSDYIPKVYDSSFTLYACADDDYIVDAADISAFTAGSTCTIAQTTLTPARNVTVKFTDADNSITAFTLTVVGKDIRGTAQTEVFTWANGLVQEGEMLFSYITSVTATAITGNSTADTLDIGFGKWVHKGLSLPSVGVTTFLDLLTCRDNYGQEYFKDLVGIQAIEYPVTTDTSGRPNYRNVSLNGTIADISYTSALEATYSIRVLWSGKHKLTFDSSTIPAYLEDAVILGAMAHAFSALGSRKIDMVNIGGAVPSQLRDIGLIKKEEFEKKLKGKKPVKILKSYTTE